MYLDPVNLTSRRRQKGAVCRPLIAEYCVSFSREHLIYSIVLVKFFRICMMLTGYQKNFASNIKSIDEQRLKMQQFWPPKHRQCKTPQTS